MISLTNGFSYDYTFFRACPRHDITLISSVPPLLHITFTGRAPVTASNFIPGVHPLLHHIYHGRALVTALRVFLNVYMLNHPQIDSQIRYIYYFMYLCFGHFAAIFDSGIRFHFHLYPSAYMGYEDTFLWWGSLKVIKLNLRVQRKTIVRF